MSWYELPWRGQHRVQKTIGASILLLAIIVLLTPLAAAWKWRIEGLALLLMLFALVLARTSEALPPSWPWRCPNPVRNTLAFVLPLLALAMMLVWRQFGDLSGVSLAWCLALTNTLLFAGAVASTGPARWLRCIAWGGLVLLSGWQLYRVLAR